MKSLWDADPGSPALVIKARIAEAVEAAAWADSFEAAAGDLSTETAQIGDATVIRMGRLPAGFFSRVMGLGLERPATPAIVSEILAWYRDTGINDIWFQPSPAAEPDGLTNLLAAQGIKPIERKWGKFVRGTGDPPDAPTGLDIREIAADRANDFAKCAVEGFELPDFLYPWLEALPGRAGWRIYVAYDGETPVACAAMFCQGGAGFIGFDATRPGFRRRGAQGALLAQRIADAGQAGLHTLTAETGVDEEEPGPSWRNIEKAGFELLYIRPNCAPAKN